MSKLVLTLDSTQIATASKCFHMWSLSYRENLVKSNIDTTALDEGSLVHAILDNYYNLKTLLKSDDSFKIIKIVLVIFTDNKVFIHYGVSAERWEFLCQRILQYICKNMNIDFQPIVKKGRPGVEIGFSKILYEDQKYLFVVEGRIDLIATISGHLVWVDHKTQGRATKLYKFKPQFLTYAWATGLNKAIINYIRLHQTYSEKDTLVKDVIEFPFFLIKEWEEFMIHKIFFPLAHILESKGINCHSNEFSRNRSACSGAFDSNPCQFIDICESQSKEMQDNIKQFAYMQIKPWRPWD